VKTILLSGAISMVIALLGTHPTIAVLRKHKLGQQMRLEGAQTTPSLGKSGTPSMGGVVIIIASLIGYVAGHWFTGEPMTASGVLVLFLMTGLGVVGFVDDYIKVFMRRRLGLRSSFKLLGQAIVGVVFALLAVRFPDGYDLTPASEHISFLNDFGVSIGLVLFVIWVLLNVTGWSNGVNLADGMDGLATGASILVLAAYVIIGTWQYRNDCTLALAPNCYPVRDPLDAAVVAAVVMGACFGFLWWNAPPAKIFMGDTGSLALGGALTGLAIVTRTELLLIILGGLFVLITMSDVIQIGVFKVTRIRTGTGKRVFKMAPLQFHFEMLGWAETTVVVRFWLIAGMFVALGLGIFYGGWLQLPKLPRLPDPERGREVRDQVFDRLDARRQADEGLRCRLARPARPPFPGRFDAAEAGRGDDQLSRRYDRVGVGCRSGELEGQQRAEASRHLLARRLRRFQAGVMDRRHPGVPGEELRDLLGVGRLAFDAQRERLHAAQHQPALEGAGDRAARCAPVAQLAGERLVPGDDGAAEDVGVAGDRLGQGVHRRYRAELERLL
jgi:phospho-N-acetylmuramoyl-pentapeptide-transferase